MSVQKVRAILLAGTAATALMSSKLASTTAIAADLGGVQYEVVGLGIHSHGRLKKALKWALRALKWIGRIHVFTEWVRPLVEAIEELIQLLDDARRAADAHKKVEQLRAKVDELEAKLVTKNTSIAEVLRLRKLLEGLRHELDRKLYVTCGRYKYRGEHGECLDKRDE